MKKFARLPIYQSRLIQSSPKSLPSGSRCFASQAAPSTRYKAATHIPSPQSANEATTKTLSRASTYLLPVYARPDFVLSHGKGSYVWDTEDRKYLDFSAGIAVNALGHADEGVVKVGRVFLAMPHPN
ncbi:hypothetical protein EDD18DRAFT_92838 [Armillaria luteobubalina]|uniref:Acetylornithine aminotransferase n=1 Tax=Armillaria luteobubalina TaxID=153913 RepID=A0AA39QAX2_9AGAR|nr:hypothetical protein EDD18DRAFT_92838 [Armillaria luteobubalina]